jgi:TonB family protein
VEVAYGPDGALQAAAWDVNRDGRYDYWERFEGDTRRHAEIDRDLDGFADLWIEFDASGAVISAREDFNRDAAPDGETLLDEARRFIRADPAVPRDRNCLNDPGFPEYVKDLQARVYREWEMSGPGRARIRFHIDRSGCPRGISVLEATDDSWSRDSLRAMQRASPLPLPPKGLECVYAHNFVGTFSGGAID